MAFKYPDREIRWPDGSAIPAELLNMLLVGLEPGFEIEHGEFSWRADGSLAMRFRLAVTRQQPRPQIWEIEFSYPAAEATAARSEATSAEREWFTMMVRVHITEWWAGGPTVATSARLVK
jgi:hypothetical protein